MRPITLICILTLLGMAGWHALSFLFDWTIWVGFWEVPEWLRFGLMLFTGILAALLYQESFGLRHLTQRGLLPAALHLPFRGSR